MKNWLSLACIGLVSLGCQSVPDIRFVADDVDASTGPANEAGTEPVVDAGPSDASGSPDSGSVSCPMPGPAGATCCGHVWCIAGGNGSCTKPAKVCQECENCADGLVCCASQGANTACQKSCT